MANAEDSKLKALKDSPMLNCAQNARWRADQLQNLYKGDMTLVSQAISSCESMDNAMDLLDDFAHGCLKDMIYKHDDKLAKEVKNKQFAVGLLEYVNGKVLGFCKRSGMALSGNKGDADVHLDKRSSIECGLAMEVCEAFDVFAVFVKRRMNLTKEEDLDRQVNSVICNIADLLDRLRKRTYFD